MDEMENGLEPVVEIEVKLFTQAEVDAIIHARLGRLQAVHERKYKRLLGRLEMDLDFVRRKYTSEITQITKGANYNNGK